MPTITTIIDKDALAHLEQNGQEQFLRAITATFIQLKKQYPQFFAKTAVSIVLRLFLFLAFIYGLFVCCYFLWITDDNSLTYGFSNQSWVVFGFAQAICILMLFIFYKKIFQFRGLNYIDKQIIKITSQKLYQKTISQMPNPAIIESEPRLCTYELSENTITCRRENDILHWQFHINYPKKSYYYMADDFCLLFIKRRFASRMYVMIWVNADNKPILSDYLHSLGVLSATLGD